MQQICSYYNVVPDTDALKIMMNEIYDRPWPKRFMSSYNKTDEHNFIMMEKNLGFIYWFEE